VKVVDLRNIFTNCNDTLIEINDNSIFYAEEKVEEGHNSLFLLEYSRLTRRERIIANYFITDPAYVQHFFSFPESILVVMERGGGKAWVMRVNKQTGAETNMADLNFIGNFIDCKALSESHVLFYTSVSEKDRGIFNEYRRLTGFSKITYLYDVDEGRYYYARDPRICGAGCGDIIVYDANGTRQLLVLQPHGSEDEKKKCYRNMRWLGDNISDNVWVCPLFDFIVSVKSGEEKNPLELILSAGTNGLVRYAGMDGINIYFRAKYYPTGDQRLCAYNKETGRKSVAAALNLAEGEKDAFFSIDPSGGRAFKITDAGDYCAVKGILNSAVDTRYSKELGRFITCIDSRYIIARYVLSDGVDSFEFNSIYDIETKSQKNYECSCTVCGDTVVMY